jgi:hypothetical protein
MCLGEPGSSCTPLVHRLKGPSHSLVGSFVHLATLRPTVHAPSASPWKSDSMLHINPLYVLVSVNSGRFRDICKLTFTFSAPVRKSDPCVQGCQPLSRCLTLILKLSQFESGTLTLTLILSENLTTSDPDRQVFSGHFRLSDHDSQLVSASLSGRDTLQS